MPCLACGWLRLVGAALVLATLGEAVARARTQGAGWEHGIIEALHMMHSGKDTGWMSDPSKCARAVNGTLQILENEYTFLHVEPVLGQACDHLNVYSDFGGHEWACRPIFVDLAAEFEGQRDYAAWCAQASSMLALPKDAAPTIAAAASDDKEAKGEKEGSAKSEGKVEAVKAKIHEVEEKKARGEDIHEELDKIKEMVKDAESESKMSSKDKASAAESEKAAAATDADAEADSESDSKKESEKDSSSEDLKVGGARWGSGSAASEGKARSKASQAPAPPDGSQPFSRVAPFGGEKKADELTGSSIEETNEMVDQMERAQAAEEKRATYRALTHLRGTMTASFDGSAGKHMQNIDEYNTVHNWRKEHPFRHLAEEEADVDKWAFPVKSA